MMLLNNKVIKLLIKKKLTISVAESCTGGLLSAMLTSVSGSSKTFKLGLTTYSNESKINNLKIKKNIVKKFGSVSSECCYNMVKNLSKIAKTDICLSITGIAGPNGGTKSKPVGLVYIGLKNKNKILIKKNIFKNKSRSYIRKSTVKESLKLIFASIK